MGGASKSFFDEAKYRQYLRTLVSSRRRIVYAVEFNNSASHLAAGNSAGQINVFDIGQSNRDARCTAPLEAGSEQQPETRTSLDHVATRFLDGTVYALYTDVCSNVLFCGTDAGIFAYRWEQLLDSGEEGEASKPCYSCTVQAGAPALDGRIEVNAIAGSSGSHIFAGTGIGTVECFTSDRLSWCERYQGGGADGYTHCVAMLGNLEDNCFVAGGDDGLLRMYDVRAGASPQKVFDMRRMTSARHRAWVGCVVADFDGQFIVCGDGNRNLTSIHVGTGAVLATTKLDFVPNSLVHRGSEIYCGGSDRVDSPPSGGLSADVQQRMSLLRRYSPTCEEVGSSPVSVSASGVYAVAYHSSSGSMAAAGYSTRHRWHDTTELIDVYLNPPIRSFTMAAAIGR